MSDGMHTTLTDAMRHMEDARLALMKAAKAMTDCGISEANVLIHKDTLFLRERISDIEARMTEYVQVDGEPFDR